VTHSLRQAHRLADHIIFIWLGEVIETGSAIAFFENPKDERSRAYLAGDIG
jgi:ABC-type phosphate transport system ATPase subunit